MHSWQYPWRVFSQALPLSLVVGLAATAGSRGAEAERPLAQQNVSGSLSVSELRCEYQQDPVGIDTQHPQLSWRLESSAPSVRQAAYQVLVASTPELLASDQGDLWNSGRVKSSDSVHMPCRGSALSSRLRYYWKAREQGARASFDDGQLALARVAGLKAVRPSRNVGLSQRAMDVHGMEIGPGTAR